MVKNDLIDRYIYAVTKHMKSAMKKDVAAELETIIQDMLEERCEDVAPTERDIKVILTELGTPDELASKYNGETQDCLIGQPYYSLYVYVLKIVTACIIGGMLLAQIMAALTSHTIGYIAIYRTIGGIFGGILIGFAFVTLLFAFFYKKGIKVDAEVISHVFIHFNKVFLSIIILALTIDGIETVVKAVKYSRQ